MSSRFDWRTPRPQFWLILGHAVFMQVVTGVARPTISYRALDLGIAPSLLGVVAATYTVIPLVFALLAGRVTDTRGERPVLIVGTVLMLGASAVLLSLTGGVGVLVGASAVLGLGQMLSILGQQTRIAGLAGAGGFDVAFGHFVLATSVGQIIGPGIISVLGGSTSMPETGPLFAAATGAAVAMMLLALLLGSTEVSGQEGEKGRAGVRKALAVPGLGIAIVTSLTVIASVDLLTVYLPLLGTERNIAASTIGALLVVRAAASMASRLFLTPLIRRYTRTHLLTWSIALAALSMGLLAVQMATWTVLVLMVCVGLGLGLGQPLTMAWVAEAAPSGLRATALSLRLAGNRLGQTVIPAGVGFVASGGGAAGVFLAIGGGLGATSMLVIGRTAPPRDAGGDADEQAA